MLRGNGPKPDKSTTTEMTGEVTLTPKTSLSRLNNHCRKAVGASPILLASIPPIDCLLIELPRIVSSLPVQLAFLQISLLFLSSRSLPSAKARLKPGVSSLQHVLLPIRPEEPVFLPSKQHQPQAQDPSPPLKQYLMNHLAVRQWIPKGEPPLHSNLLLQPHRPGHFHLQSLA